MVETSCPSAKDCVHLCAAPDITSSVSPTAHAGRRTGAPPSTCSHGQVATRSTVLLACACLHLLACAARPGTAPGRMHVLACARSMWKGVPTLSPVL